MNKLTRERFTELEKKIEGKENSKNIFKKIGLNVLRREVIELTRIELIAGRL